MPCASGVVFLSFFYSRRLVTKKEFPTVDAVHGSSMGTFCAQRVSERISEPMF